MIHSQYYFNISILLLCLFINFGISNLISKKDESIFNHCGRNSKCDKLCQDYSEYCRIIFCEQENNSQNFKINPLLQQDQKYENEYFIQHINQLINCVELCIYKFFTLSSIEQHNSLFQCLYSTNLDYDLNQFSAKTFFSASSLESVNGYFINTKPHVLVQRELKKSLLEDLLLRFGFQSTDNQAMSRLFWNSEDQLIIEGEITCEFQIEQEGGKQQKNGSIIFLQHPVKWVQLLTRKDCLKYTLEQFAKYNKEQEVDENYLLNNKNNVDEKDSLKQITLDSFSINLKSNTSSLFSPIYQASEQFNTSSYSAFVLKPVSSNKGAGLKLVNKLDELLQQMKLLKQKKLKLVYSSYILEPFINHSLLINNQNVSFDLQFFVSILSTQPLLAYSLYSISRINADSYYFYKNASIPSPPPNKLSYEFDKYEELIFHFVERDFIPIRELLTSANISPEIQMKLISKCYSSISFTLSAFLQVRNSQLKNTQNVPDDYFNNEISFLRFDFIVDSSFQPHLIEVDDSPLSSEIFLYKNQHKYLEKAVKKSLDYSFKLHKISLDKQNPIKVRALWIKIHPFNENEENEHIHLIVNETNS